MIDELKRILKSTTEEEAKSLLLQTLYGIHMNKEVTEYTDSDLAADVKRTYNDFLQYKRKQATEQRHDYKSYHLVFGDSPAGSLKQALKKMKLNQEEKVISFSDLFSIGPLTKLEEAEGVLERREWFENHLIVDDDFPSDYLYSFNKTIDEIRAIPSNAAITIWAGENAHEQTGLRLVMRLLNERSNDIQLINSTELHRKLLNTLEIQYQLLHTGEISPEQLITMYKKGQNTLPLTPEERISLEKEYTELSTTNEVLRIWQGDSIQSVEEGYFDDLIIQTARRLFAKRGIEEFMKSARLIGELIGHLNQYVGDQFFEYRVRHLILNGVFEIKGVPKAMRFYSIRFKK
ncbi:DUF1835 domain-containing protein [Rossellomorea aquimaris]|uniref:DUF1835 domain-containing protein n=1 Tax=Rossellomorea aquimaris TaxID=189382 RepID=A0A5D4TXN6_9BACI|nr:DUF1835 domain-containing protein [Rossellomorea aquimaris]TYS79760.1 DUF1835 domain-containing protein [Rossellomorea aquimaris]